jgi:hypothetical protein
MGFGFTSGPHTARPGALRLYRGSRRRLARIAFRKNQSVEFWMLVVVGGLLLFGVVPWLVTHSLHDHRHTPTGRGIGPLVGRTATIALVIP